MDHRIIAFQAFFGMEMFFDDDEEVEIEDKIENYYEQTIPRFNNLQFKRHFRLHPTNFADLLTKLQSVTCFNVSRGHAEIHISKQLMITLWYLGNMECYRSVCERFNVTKSSCWEILNRTCKRLLLINERYKIISWPQDSQTTIEDFQQIAGFPGVLGSIDGTHIRIIAPKTHPNSYINRKGYHSLVLQCVCNSHKVLTDAFVGMPGSVHDARVWRTSDLYRKIENNEIEFPQNSHLIGDQAYPLRNSLMVAYKNFGNLTARQITFNKKLSKTRVCIENAFALLKGRFRKLQFLETTRLDVACIMIMASCVLHNFCLLRGDQLEDAENEQVLDDRLLNLPDGNHEIQAAAMAKRNEICNSL